MNLKFLTSDQAEQACSKIISTLPEYFGIPEANESYVKGVRERFSIGLDVNGVLKGMVSCEIPFPNNCNIYWMGVTRDSHGQGIGSSLIRHAEDYAREKGCRSLTVETLSPREIDPHYTKTYHFYLSRGFHPLFELNTHGSDFKMVYLYMRL